MGQRNAKSKFWHGIINLMSVAQIITKLVDRGKLTDQNQFEIRRAHFFNIILLFIIAATIIMVFAAHSWTSKILNVVGVVVFIMLYYLHGFKPKFSVLLLGLVYQTFIFLHSSIIDIGGQVEYGALAMTIVLPIFYRRKVAFYFMLSNIIVFYFPYLILDAYQSFFKLAYVFAIGLFFTVRAFVKENEKHEAILLKKQNELKELNQQKNHLIQVVAHDLKSPLSQIEGLTGLIKLSNKSSNQEDGYLDKIVDSVHHMSSMISRILDVEKIEKQEPAELKKLNIIPILQNVAAHFKLLAANKKIKIELKLLDDEIWIVGNAHYLQQIFHNLLSNAIKFSPQGTKIVVKVEKTDVRVKVKFEDEGPGISINDQKKLFIKFQKLTAQPTNNEDSTGLGLALTKSFVDALSGLIYCESELGKGATFVVDFITLKSNR